LKQRQLAIKKQKAEMEEILLDDKDEDGDASSTNESEDEVVEVGRGAVKADKKPPGKLAPIFMLGKPPKVQQTNNYSQFLKQISLHIFNTHMCFKCSVPVPCKILLKVVHGMHGQFLCLKTFYSASPIKIFGSDN